MNYLLSLLLFLLVLSVLIFLALMEHSTFEQIDLGATVHASFDELEPIHMPLQRSITPRKRQASQDSIFILLNTCDKRFKFGQSTLLCVCEPLLQVLTRSFSQHL